MKKSVIVLFLLLLTQSSFAQENEQLNELVITNKKAKLFKVSKGKKAKVLSFNYDFDTYFYVLDALPYGILQELTLYSGTNYQVLKHNDKKNAETVYNEWCAESFFDVMVYAYEEGTLLPLTEKPLSVPFQKTRELNFRRKIDFSAYNFAGSQFVLAITLSKTAHYCEKCPIYGITLFKDEKEMLFNTKVQKIEKGRGLKYDIVIRSKNYE